MVRSSEWVLVISLELTHNCAHRHAWSVAQSQTKIHWDPDDGRNGGAQVCGSADGELAGAADVADLR